MLEHRHPDTHHAAAFDLRGEALQLAGALDEALGSNALTVVDVVTSLGPSFRDVTSPLLD